MLLRQMRYFVSVVENNSFIEAAEQEFISQSAISQQIQSLETELGTELFIRQHRKFRLTSAGEYFYQESRQILSRIDRIILETQRIGSDDDAHPYGKLLEAWKAMIEAKAAGKFVRLEFPI